MVEQRREGRREAVSEHKRGLILKAARDVFEVEGLEAASLRAIAARAGYTPAALYFYFDSKEAIYAEVLRTTGFAFSPGIFRVLAAVPPPPLGFAFTVATDLWMLVAGIIAVRQALDFTTLRAIATFGVSYLLLWLTLSGLLISLPL